MFNLSKKCLGLSGICGLCLVAEMQGWIQSGDVIAEINILVKMIVIS